MKSVLYLIAVLFFIASSISSKAQNENNIWCFGRNIGLDFNMVPTGVFHTQMSVVESSSSVCDANGQLLFYTSGAFIWDKNGNFMPNGQNLSGNGPYTPSPAYPQNTGSSSAGVLVIQSPSNPNQYYQIVTDAIEDQIYHAYYSLIDMTLNGGLGDVVLSQRNIMFVDSVQEGVFGTRGLDCHSAWFVMKHKNGNNLLSFKIDQAGIHTTPVISNTATSLIWGKVTFNKSGSIFCAINNGLVLYDFNKATGVFSYTGLLQSPLTYASTMEFSPDDSKLYLGGPYGLVQFDVTSYPNIPSIQSTIVNLSDTPITTMRTSPQGKIHFCWIFTSSLSTINAPNAAGAAANITYNDLLMSDTAVYITTELGKPAIILHPTDSFFTAAHDTICKASSWVLSSTMSNCNTYVWSTGASTSSITINNEGIYWVAGIKDCSVYTDTFDIHFRNINVDLGPDTTICKGDALLLDATTANAVYYWQDGSTGPTYTTSKSGVYTVAVTQNNCVERDTINLEVVEPYLKIIEPDTIICKAQSITLHTMVKPESTFQWNTGDTVSVIVVNDSGTFVVKATNSCGIFYDSVNVAMMDCFCNAFMPTAFTPNGDGNNDVLMARLNCPGSSNFVLNIYNRYGQQVFKTNNVNEGWDGMHNNQMCDMGTYFYYLQYRNDEGKMVKRKGDIALLR